MGNGGIDEFWEGSFSFVEPRHARVKKRRTERFEIEKSRSLGFSSPIVYTGPLYVESRIDRVSKRPLPTSPFRVLDAPSILNDYYLNLLDWSKDNLIGLGLSEQLYIWNASNKSVVQLCELPEGQHISSISFSPAGLLAVGGSDGTTSIFDVQYQKRVCSFPGRPARVGSLAWGGGVLSGGGKDGNIFNYDVRTGGHISSFLSHTQEVCGLKWDLEGMYLASGANDNNVCIWRGGYSRPRNKFTEHRAAVRGIGWCPWKKGILATGGGTDDRSIRTWDVEKGVCLSSLDSGSQVCSILFSERYKEMITTHGYSENNVSVWKYCSMRRIGNMNGHTGRVLFSALSPDGETLATCGADENLNFWNLFQKKEEKKTEEELVSFR